MRAQVFYRNGAWLLWQVVRLPTFTLLVILEPVARLFGRWLYLAF
jgi:hypothetical protein